MAQQPNSAWTPVDESAWTPVHEDAPPPPSTFGGQLVDRVKENALGLLHPIIHPSSILEGAGWSDPSKMGDLISDIREQPNKTGAANALGDLITAGAMGAASHFAPRLAEPLGERMKASGGRLIDRTAGVTQKDVNFGAQPGRAYLEGGGKPTMSLGGLAESADAIKKQTGPKLRNLYTQNTSVIPATDVMNEVMQPINRLRTLTSGAGGTGEPASLAEYESNTLNPVFAASNRGGFTPVELFDEMKRPISENTRWNDPSIYDINEVRQETVGRLGNMLTDLVPEAKPLNKVYQGNSALAKRAAIRSETGQSPLTTLGRKAMGGMLGASLGYASHNPLLGLLPLALDTVPARTAVARGLFDAGKGLPIAGEGLRSVAPLTSIARPNGSKKRPDDDNDK